MSRIIVQKFGGSSVADADRIRQCAQRIVATKQAGNHVVVVVSARGDKTDELIELARQISHQPPPREMDMLLATGEQESVALMAMAVQELGVKAISLTGYQIGIVTDSTHTKARILEIPSTRIRDLLNDGYVVIAAGFQGIDKGTNNITTLGRGGSDTTAAALAAVLKADVCEIYTDVEGIFTTDPRIVKTARKIPSMSYDEMLELTSLGGGKMHSRSIEFAKKHGVRLQVKPAHQLGDGTLIVPMNDSDAPVVSSVALVKSETIVNLRDLPDRPGVMSALFERMAERKIPIDMVIQDAVADKNAAVTFTVPQDDLADALTAAEEAVKSLGAGTVHHHPTKVSKVSAVGGGMRTHTGVAAQMFQSLAKAGINITLITTSEIKISVLVDQEQSQLALNTVHEGFKLHEANSVLPSVGYIQKAEESRPRLPQKELEREVVDKLTSMEDIVVSMVELDEQQARVSIRNVRDQPGVAAEVFATVAEGGVMVDMIVQNVGLDGQTNLSFTVPRNDLERCLLLVRELIEAWPGAELSYATDMALLTVMGIGLRSHTGVGERLFRALSDVDVNVQMVNTSEIRFGVVVAQADGRKAHQALLDAFQLTHPA